MKSPEVQLHSQAFNIENLQNVHDMELRDDIRSYLGEYRLNVQEYNYKLRFSSGQDGLRLRDVYGGEALSAKAARTIEKRRRFGEPTQREEAELLGIISLEDQLRFAQNGDTILWASPPGPKNEGYGDYGFIYVGNILTNGQALHLSMTAIRIEQPTITQFNQAFTALSDIRTDFDCAEDFLQTPRVIRQEVDLGLIETILRRCFSFEKNNTEGVFQKVISKLRPMVEEFIDFVKGGVKEEKLRAFYALENYALELKGCYEHERQGTFYFDDRRYQPLYDIMRTHGHKPPRVTGSCGPSGETKSNGLFNRYETLFKTIFGEQEWFTCPRCHYQADGPIGDNPCPGCGLTKEQHKESGEEVCD